MKNLYFFAFLILSVNLKAQTITLTANGFVDASDSTKNYIVLDQKKTSKMDLYKKTLTYLNGIYKNPAAVISSVDGESITVNARGEFQTTEKLFNYPFSYTLLIQFKDGKMKFQPELNNINEIYIVSDKLKKVYLRNTDSPDIHEINAIFFKSKKDGLYYPLKDEIIVKLNSWANSSLENIKTALNDKW